MKKKIMTLMIDQRFTKNMLSSLEVPTCRSPHSDPQRTSDRTVLFSITYHTHIHLTFIKVYSKYLLVIAIAKCQRAKIVPTGTRCLICSEMS